MVQQTILNDSVYVWEPERARLPALRVALTRFCMSLQGFREAGNLVEERAFQAWLQRRIQIFQSLCLRSVAAQSERFDAWLLGFDAARRDQFAPVLRAIAPHPWIIPVWQEWKNGEPENARYVFLRALQPLFQPTHEWLISTRLDNDDALGRSYGEATADYAAAAVAARPDLQDFWISFPLGAQFGDGLLRLMPQNNNAFLTRVERIGGRPSTSMGTALQGNHGHVFKHQAVFTPTTREPMWLQFVHGTNVSNRTNLKLMELADTDRELRRFVTSKQRLDALIAQQ